MSTFETAYELADVVTYVIASQSLLPIGTDYADFVWPYEQLLADLLTANFQENLTTHVGDFYESNFSEIATLVTVHIALLDLGGVNGMTGPLKDLTKALKKVLTLDQRGLLIEQRRIVAFDQNGDLSAGDAALMDVQKMCVQMQTHPNPDISAAATSVLAGLTTVIGIIAKRSRRGRSLPDSAGSAFFTGRPRRGFSMTTLRRRFTKRLT